MTDAEYAVTVATWFAGYMLVACVVMYVWVRCGNDEGDALPFALGWPFFVCIGGVVYLAGYAAGWVAAQ